MKVLDRPHQFEYGLIELCNPDHDNQIKLQTPILQMGFQKYVPLNRLNEYLIVSTSRINSQLFKTKIFNSSEILYELYKSQRKNLTMSVANFYEIGKLRIK